MAEPPAKRQKVDQTPETLSFEDFAANGDVVFIVKGKTRVRVHSVVMMRASSVFAAMLGPNFKEGRALAEASAAPVEIPLPEDDPEPFGWICRALHCQASTRLWKPVTARLLSVWKLIDKYDMKDGMQLSLGFWIRELLNGGEPRERDNYALWLLAQISLGVQDAGSFALVTRKLILENTKSSFVRMATISEPDIPIIPGRLLYKLAATLQAVHDPSMAALVKLIYSDLPKILQGCDSATAWYFQHLNFPDTDVSLRTVSSAIPLIIAWAGRTTCPCDVDECEGNFQQLLEKALSLRKLETSPANGLCLSCFDSPKCPNHKK